MSIRVLAVGSLPPPQTGPSVSFSRLVQSMEDAGWTPRVVNLAKPAGQYAGLGVLARAFALLGIWLGYIRQLLGRPDVVYLLLSSGKLGFFRDCLFLWPAHVLRRPVICHLKSGRYDAFHRVDGGFRQRLVLLTLRRCCKIIVLSPRLISLFQFLDQPEKVVAVLNGLPANDVPPPPQPRPGSEKVQVLYLSNLMTSKGYLDLIEAATILAQDPALSGRFEVHLAGRIIPDETATGRSITEIETELHARLGTAPLKNHVVWHGPVDGTRKTELLQKADVFVLPTNYPGEGQPVSIIEALAHGTAILSTEYRAIPDMVQPGVNGAFIEFGNPNGLAQELTRLIEAPDVRESYRNASYQIFQDDFTWADHCDRILTEISSCRRTG